MEHDDLIAEMKAKGIPFTISLAVAVAPNSFEFGPANARHKIYYSDPEDLKRKIEGALKAEFHLNELRGQTGGASS